jgi:hypothetical protein
MNNQKLQIIVGILLVVVYFTYFRSQEGFLGKRSPKKKVGKDFCFTDGPVTVQGDYIVGTSKKLYTDGPECKNGKEARVLIQLIPHKPSRKKFARPRIYLRIPGGTSGRKFLKKMRFDKRNRTRNLMNMKRYAVFAAQNPKLKTFQIIEKNGLLGLFGYPQKIDDMGDDRYTKSKPRDDEYIFSSLVDPSALEERQTRMNVSTLAQCRSKLDECRARK